MQDFSLKLESGSVDFSFDCKKSDNFYFHIVIDGPGDVSICRDMSCCFSRKDIERLLLYFETHIQTLGRSQGYESYVFVPQQLDLQIQALSGSVESSTDGYFSVRCMLNCRPDGYWGVEGVLDLLDLSDFTNNLKLFLVD